MSVLVVMENPEDCSLVFSGVEPVAARSYLADEAFTVLKHGETLRLQGAR